MNTQETCVNSIQQEGLRFFGEQDRKQEIRGRCE